MVFESATSGGPQARGTAKSPLETHSRFRLSKPRNSLIFEQCKIHVRNARSPPFHDIPSRAPTAETPTTHLSYAAVAEPKGHSRSLLWDTRASIDAVLAIAPYNRRLTTQSFNPECADRRRPQKMAPRSGRALIDKFLRRAGPLLGGFRGAEAAGRMKMVLARGIPFLGHARSAY